MKRSEPHDVWVDGLGDQAQQGEVGWYSVRCVFRMETDSAGPLYEERLTLWRAEDFDQAIALAEAEALEHADPESGMTFAGLAQAYRLFHEPGHGAEVFSLVRESGLAPEAYLTRFFDTGQERQGRVTSDS